MKRAAALASVFVAALGVGAAGAPSRSTLEIFGVGAGDSIEVDGHSVPVKTGVAHAFGGQPLPGDAPAITELSSGAHELTLHRAGCSPRTFSVDVQGAYHRAIVVAPTASTRCAIPAMPARVQ